MITYKPLFETLHEKNLKIKDLYDVIGPDTATKFKKGESMRLDTIEKVCLHLNVGIERVVNVIPDND